MSLEHRSEAGECDPARGELTPGEPFGGWEMVQSDWGSRQVERRSREDHDDVRERGALELRRSPVIAALRAGLAATAGWLRRLVRALATTVGGGSGTPRNSAPRS